MQLYESTPEAVKSEMATFFTVFPDGIIAGNTFRGVGYDTVLLGQAGPTRIDVDALDARLSDPAYAAVAQSLREVGVRSAVDLLASYAGRAADLQPWLRDAAINHDGDLRLQYLAGLGLNANEGDRVYAEILKYRRYPDDLFVGSESALARCAAGSRVNNRHREVTKKHEEHEDLSSKAFVDLRVFAIRRRQTSVSLVHQARSNRSRFMTLSHAATKSRTNFSCASSHA